MDPFEDYSLESCRQILQRIAWRIRYRVRIEYKREVPIFNDRIQYDIQIIDYTSPLYINELIQNISSSKAQYIIKKIFIDGQTEEEIAKELGITQQAVSKWKKRGLQMLRQHIESEV